MKNFKKSKTKTSKIEKNDLIFIMTPEKQNKTLELSKHWSVDSTPARKLRPRKLRPRKLRPRKLRPRKLRPTNIVLRKALFSLFPNSFPFRDDCVQNPENRTGQVLSSFRHCAIYIFPYGSKTHSFILKCGLFTNVQFICQCRMSKEC